MRVYRPSAPWSDAFTIEPPGGGGYLDHLLLGLDAFTIEPPGVYRPSASWSDAFTIEPPVRVYRPSAPWSYAFTIETLGGI